MLSNAKLCVMLLYYGCSMGWKEVQPCQEFRNIAGEHATPLAEKMTAL